MRARKCDRCGSFYDEYAEKTRCRGKDVNGVAFVHKCTDGDFTGYKADAYDLCPCCMTAVLDFVKGGTKDDKA